MSEYRVLPYAGGTPRQISEVVNNAMGGKINATGTINLESNSATATSLPDIRISTDSVVLFMPTNTASATFMNGMFISEKVDGSATISHSMNTATSATFSYLIIG